MIYLEIFSPIVLLVLGYLLGKSRDHNKQIYNKKLEIYSNIVFEINNHNYARVSDQSTGRSELVKLFSPARLIGGDKVIKELREYFSLVTEFYETTDSKKQSEIMDKISISAMELEQLMRKDLGKRRNLSKFELFFHHALNSKN